MTLRSRLFSSIGLVAMVVVLDQVIKYLVESGLPFRQMIEVIPFLALYRTHNTGMAFSMLNQYGPGALIALALLVSCLVAWLWSKSPESDRIANIGFALIMGGAIGNLVDRVMLGYVVDYILFHTPVWSFAIFNLADAAITIGAGLVILQELLRYRRQGSSNARQ